MLSAVSLPQASQPQPTSTRRATTSSSSSSSSSSSVLQRGRSAAMKKLRSLAAAPESPPRATEPFPRAAAPAAAGDGAPAARVVGALLGRGEAARDARRHPAPQTRADAQPPPPAQRRRDLCTPSAEVEEWLQRCSAMAEFEMSVAVGCGVFGGVDYQGLVVRDGEARSEGEREDDFVDCRAEEEEHGAV